MAEKKTPAQKQIARLNREAKARLKEEAKARAVKKPHKYGARAQVVDGMRFSSKLEAKRYAELQLMVRAGAIVELALQPRFPLVVNDKRIATYVGDFSYREVNARGMVCPLLTIEDTKGVVLSLYKLKRKLLLALYSDIDFREIRK